GGLWGPGNLRHRPRRPDRLQGHRSHFAGGVERDPAAADTTVAEMIGRDTRDPRRGHPDRKVAVRTLGLVLLGALVIAAAAVSVWFAVGPRGDAVMPEPRLAAGGERAFKLTPYESPRSVPNVEFEDGQGMKRTLADFRGKVVLLNLWATWC